MIALEHMPGRAAHDAPRWRRALIGDGSANRVTDAMAWVCFVLWDIDGTLIYNNPLAADPCSSSDPARDRRRLRPARCRTRTA